MRQTAFVALATGFALALPIRADVLETRDGRVLEGTYLGGTQQSLRFRAGDEVQVFLTEEVLALTFTGPTPRTAPRPEPPAAKRKGPAAARSEPAATRTPVPEPRAASPQPPAPSASARHPSAAPSHSAQQPPPAPSATAKQPPPAPPGARAPVAPSVARVPAGTSLRVRIVDGIDSRQSAAGDRFSATLETGLGVEGVAVVPAGSKLYGQIAELRPTGPVASRPKLELTQLMIRGELLDIVTGSQLAAAEPSDAAGTSTTPARRGIGAGSVLEFRLLQPFEVRTR